MGLCSLVASWPVEPFSLPSLLAPEDPASPAFAVPAAAVVIVVGLGGKAGLLPPATAAAAAVVAAEGEEPAPAPATGQVPPPVVDG